MGLQVLCLMLELCLEFKFFQKEHGAADITSCVARLRTFVTTSAADSTLATHIRNIYKVVSGTDIKAWLKQFPAVLLSDNGAPQVDLRAPVDAGAGAAGWARSSAAAAAWGGPSRPTAAAIAPGAQLWHRATLT